MTPAERERVFRYLERLFDAALRLIRERARDLDDREELLALADDLKQVEAGLKDTERLVLLPLQPLAMATRRIRAAAERLGDPSAPKVRGLENLLMSARDAQARAVTTALRDWEERHGIPFPFDDR